VQTRFLKRLWLPFAIILAMAGAIYAILNAFNQNLTFFYSPSQLLAGEVPKDKTYR
jgi:cytochrome c-type biogenesis protein CcmE